MNINSALIIDDDKDLCFLLREVLRTRKIPASITNTLNDAKKAIYKHIPNIIILDNSLPDGKGSEFVAYLNLTCPQSKIIFITGDYDAFEEEFKGITFFIRKPFTLDKIQSVIDRISNS